MKDTMHTLSHCHPQRGISLVTVLVLLLLSLVAVLGAFRVANLNEAMLGNSSDYNRARVAAEALILDAEMDIRGRRPPYATVQTDGTIGFPCRPAPANSTTSLVTEGGYVGCRNQAAANTPWFPRNSEDFDAVSDLVESNSATLRCMQGICVPLNTTDLAFIENNLANMTPLGATYGQFTRNALAAPGVSGNPILSSDTAKAWYWVEAFRYNSDAVNSGAASINALVPDPTAPFIYRITAIAQGMKAGTRVVIKSVFVPYPLSQGK
jgi:type IV pilus assembly protein PilX